MPVVRLGQAVLGVLLFCATIVVVVNDMTARKVLMAARPILNDVVLTGEDVERLAQYPGNKDLSCRRDIQEAAMSVKLAVLERRLVTTASTDQIDRAYLMAKQGIRHFLSCFPLNGNGWMRLAMSSMRLEGPTEGVLQAVELTELTSPGRGGCWERGFRF